MADNAYVQIDAMEFICSRDRLVLGHLGFAIFFDLAMFASREDIEATEPERLCRLTGVSEHVFRKEWPKIEPFFEKTERGTLRLKPPDWMSVRIAPSARVPLTHLLPELVSFWGDACVYCGTSEEPLHIEHIIPIVRGGSNHLDNLTLACRSCNLKKGAKTAAEFGYSSIQDKAQRRVQ